MNKKFIKENKPLVKEFLSNMILKILTGKVSRDIQKKLDSDPIIAKHKANIKKIETQMIDKIKLKRKQDPNFDKKLSQIFSN